MLLFMYIFEKNVSGGLIVYWCSNYLATQIIYVNINKNELFNQFSKKTVCNSIVFIEKLK